MLLDSVEKTASIGMGVVLLSLVSAFALTCAMVAGTIRICRRRGWVAIARENRWHRGAPSLFGGVPLWLGFVLVCALYLPWDRILLWKLIGISALIFLLGLADDIWRLSPWVKLVVQSLAGVLVVICGVAYPLRNSSLINAAVTLVWIVGITNAFNLLDNMDGLAAGVGLISAVYLGIFYLSRGAMDNVLVMAALAGALAAFLLFNFKPARIFMGDTGSLLLGFVLATHSVLQATHLSGISSFMMVPALIMAVPIFDTFFVSVSRRWRGQPISQGGVDHSSHRLVRLGLDERSAVVVLYLLSAGAGAAAQLVRLLAPQDAVGLMAFCYLFFLVFGVHLFQPEAGGHHAAQEAPIGLLRRMMSRDTLAILLDPAALLLSYYLAYFVRFTRYPSPQDFALFFQSAAVVLGSKFLCLWGHGIYRRSWWRGCYNDKLRLIRGALIGELLAVAAIVGWQRFNGYSRTVFALDALFSVLLLLLIRESFPLFRTLVSAAGLRPAPERRVFVLGTSENSELILRFLRHQRIRCVGLIDTNAGSDLGKLIWGTPVMGRVDDLGRLVAQHGTNEVVLPENEAVPYPEAEFRRMCQNWNVQLTRLGFYRSAAAQYPQQSLPTVAGTTPDHAPRQETEANGFQ